jgi:parvulin-like peptidyl-prolyl isomerase
MGELLMIPPRFEDELEYEIERQFGKPFTSELFNLEMGNWQGPVESAYGWHLVLIRERTAGEIPELSKVRDQVEREWMVEQRKERKNKQYDLMRSRYSITVERHEKKER